MAVPPSVQNLFKHRKYPFIFTLTTLFFFLVLLAYNSDTSRFSISDLQTRTGSEPSIGDVLPFDNGSVAAELKWELCGEGLSAVDYIPCLDNAKAIKGLASRRHMEHRERHCPDPAAPRCLSPLPGGYKVPVAWPKSRDMVSFFGIQTGH